MSPVPNTIPQFTTSLLGPAAEVWFEQSFPLLLFFGILGFDFLGLATRATRLANVVVVVSRLALAFVHAVLVGVALVVVVDDADLGVIFGVNSRCNGLCTCQVTKGRKEGRKEEMKGGIYMLSVEACRAWSGSVVANEIVEKKITSGFVKYMMALSDRKCGKIVPM
jgi:hypothetical protein